MCILIFCFVFFSVREEQINKRMYSGSMKIENQVFENAYENSSSPEFKALAQQVLRDVSLSGSLS